jgi:hypothetical protein
MCEALPHYRPRDACAQIVGSEEVLQDYRMKRLRTVENRPPENPLSLFIPQSRQTALPAR